LSKPGATGVLFFDEMNLASNMIKAQFYKLINDRAVGDIPLSDGVLCVSAGNEVEHSRGVTQDPVPLVLRRGNYFLRPLNQEEWVGYAVKTAHHPWIVGYLAFQPNDLHNVEYDLPDSVGQPCPRTWTRLSSILNSLNNPGLDEVELFSTGLVGQGVAKKFVAYVKSAMDIDINVVIKNPELVAQYEASGDVSLVYAVVSGVVDKFRNDKKVIGPLFSMSLHFQRAELGAFLIRSAKSVDEKLFIRAGSDSKLLSEEIVKQVVDRYAKFLFN
jgi:hypothetical protein